MPRCTCRRHGNTYIDRYGRSWIADPCTVPPRPPPAPQIPRYYQEVKQDASLEKPDIGRGDQKREIESKHVHFDDQPQLKRSRMQDTRMHHSAEITETPKMHDYSGQTTACNRRRRDRKKEEHAGKTTANSTSRSLDYFSDRLRTKSYKAEAREVHDDWHGPDNNANSLTCSNTGNRVQHHSTAGDVAPLCCHPNNMRKPKLSSSDRGVSMCSLSSNPPFMPRSPLPGKSIFSSSPVSSVSLSNVLNSRLSPTESPYTESRVQRYDCQRFPENHPRLDALGKSGIRQSRRNEFRPDNWRTKLRRTNYLPRNAYESRTRRWRRRWFGTWI